MRRAQSLMLLTVALGVLIGALALLNALPTMVSDGPVRPYATLDEARRALGWQRPLLPAYFPSYIAWPPAEVLAGTEPVPTLVVQFRHREQGTIVLSLAQVRASHEAVPLAIEPVEAVETSRRSINGHDAVVARGRCADGGLCTSIDWQQGDFHMSMGLRDGIDELVRMAHSVDQQAS